MKTISSFPVLLLVFLLGILSTNCKKDNPSTVIKEADEINKFIWTSMHDYYLWQSNVTNLTNTQFSKSDSLNAFLNKYSDHSKLFYDLLYQYNVIDKWSWIVDDYTTLENELQGITKTAGYDFRLGEFTGTTTLFGVVRYVIKGSPADLAGIKRGDIFVKVNDQEITEANYMSILFNQDSYKLSFATLANNSITPNGVNITVTAAEVHENPIYLDTVYNANYQKIGYLVYNGFMSDYDIQLNNVFKKFKDAGVTKLILDLRYNGGGSIQTAIYLASMIYGTSSSNVFLKTQYNTALEAYLKTQYGDSYFSQSFTGTIAKTTTTAETPINSLGLGDLYVITTGSTASASELVINGLMPYITVKTIGTNTVGKYVGSTTIKDYDANGNLNTSHKWALQPIILKVSNKNDVSDYVNGFTPTVEVKEDISKFLPFGNTNEPMLQTALNLAQGLPLKQDLLKSAGIDFKVVADSKDFLPHGKEMYMETPNLNRKK
jgi:C-terminal processing protease CtpA/Prc